MYKWSRFEDDGDPNISKGLCTPHLIFFLCYVSGQERGIREEFSIENHFPYIKYFTGKFSFERSRLRNDEDILIMKIYTLTLKDIPTSNNIISNNFVYMH